RLLKGVVGQFFAALSITLTIAVLVSLVLALTIIPLMADQFLTAQDAEAEDVDREPPREKTSAAADILRRIHHGLDTLSVRYQESLERVLHHRRWVLITGGILIVAGVVAERFVGTGFLPDGDDGACVSD